MVSWLSGVRRPQVLESPMRTLTLCFFGGGMASTSSDARVALFLGCDLHFAAFAFGREQTDKFETLSGIFRRQEPRGREAPKANQAWIETNAKSGATGTSHGKDRDRLDLDVLACFDGRGILMCRADALHTYMQK